MRAITVPDCLSKTKHQNTSRDTREQRQQGISHGIVGCSYFPHAHGLNCVIIASLALRTEGRQKHGTEQDTLPAFASLANDEDRERKAEFQLPGTYYVVLTDASFADLEEYQLTKDEVTRRSSISTSGHLQQNLVWGTDSNQGTQGNFMQDPNVVILDKFEETPLKLSSSNRLDTGRTTPPTPTSLPTRFAAQTTTQGLPLDPFRPQAHNAEVSPNRHEANLLSHYRNRIRQQLIPSNQASAGIAEISSSSTLDDMFEREAVTFPPVRHRILT